MPAGRPRKPRELAKATMRDDNTMADGRAVPSMAIVPRCDDEIVPVSPVDLSERGQIEWDKVWTAGHWLKADQDYHLVVALAEAYDEIEAYRDQIKIDGLMTRGSAGGMIANPLIKEVRACQATIIKCLSLLGFSPSDRMRLGIQEIQRANGLADLQAKARRNAQR